jgi:hypothetical protein
MALKLKELIVELKANIRDFKQKMGTVAATIAGLGKTLGAPGFLTGGLAALGGVAQQLAKDLQRVFNVTMRIAKRVAVVGLAAITAGFVLATREGARFENAMERTFAVMGGRAQLGAQIIHELTETARRLGRETLFSGRQAAEGMQILALAGFSAVEIMQTLPRVIDLAVASAGDLQSVASTVIATMRAFAIDTDQAGRVVDVLTLAFTNANVTLTTLSESLKFSGAIAAAAGFQFEELTAAIMTLGNAGVQGSMAGTSLRQAINQMLRPSEDAIATMQKLGLQFLDLTGTQEELRDAISEGEKQIGELSDEIRIATRELFKMKREGKADTAEFKELSDALTEMRLDLSDANEVVRQSRNEFRLQGGTLKPLTAIVDQLARSGANAAQVMQIFQIRGGLAATILKAGAGTFKEYVKLLNEVSENTKEWGAVTQRIAETFVETFLGTIQNLMATFGEVAIQAFDAFGEALRQQIDSTRLLINEMVQAVKQNELFEAVVENIGRLIEPLRSRFEEFGQAILEALQNMSREDVDAFFDTMRIKLSAVKDFMLLVFNIFRKAFAAAKEAVVGAVEAFSALPKDLQEIVMLALIMSTSFGRVAILAMGLKRIFELIKIVIEKIEPHINRIAMALRTINPLLGAFVGDSKEANEAIKNVADGMREAAETPFELGAAPFTEQLVNAMRVARGEVEKMKEEFREMGDETSNLFGDADTAGMFGTGDQARQAAQIQRFGDELQAQSNAQKRFALEVTDTLGNTVTEFVNTRQELEALRIVVESQGKKLRAVYDQQARLRSTGAD